MILMRETLVLERLVSPSMWTGISMARNSAGLLGERCCETEVCDRWPGNGTYGRQLVGQTEARLTY